MRATRCRTNSLVGLCLIAVLTLAIFVSGGQCSDNFSIDGYYKSFFVGYELPSVSTSGRSLDLPPLGSVSNRLRLNVHLGLHENASFTMSYDFAPRVQDHLLFEESVMAASIDPFGYRVDDLRSYLYPSRSDEVASFAIFQNLDRAFFEIRTELADIFIGRQPIAWGSARAVNPTDILAPYTYETLDTEDRVGIDAIRARIPLGFMGELDAGCVFGEDFKFDKSALYLRTKFYMAHTDISLLAIGYRENLMLGVDLTRAIGGAGFWLEAAHNFADALTDEITPGAEDFFRVTVGSDYSFGGETYAFIEYHFNQAGANDPGQYFGNAAHTAYTEGSTYLLGRHYLIPGVSYQVTPLISATLETLCNLSDWSAYMAPSVEYNIAENIYLAGGAFVGVGKSPDLLAGPRSEFGSYPDIFFTSFRVYF